MEINRLLNNEESLWLEYKSYWYWNGEQQSISNELDEFLKDIIALFNTWSPGEFKKKYLIVGYNEKTKLCNHFYEDNTGTIIKKLSKNEDDFKYYLLSKLKKTTIMVCKDKTIPFDIDFISQYINVTIVEWSQKKLLLIEIYEAPCLLSLSRDIKTYRSNSCIIRTLRNKGKDPEVTVATVEYINDFKNKKGYNSLSCQPRQKSFSIKKLVESYKKKYLPKSIVNYYSNEKSKYEYYELTQESSSTSIAIFYISRYTSQKQAIINIKEKGYITGSINKIFVIVDDYNKTGGSIDLSRIQFLFKEEIDISLKTDCVFNTVQQFSLNNIYEEMNDKLFHTGKFAINDFIQPRIHNHDFHIQKFVMDWFKKENSPLLVVKGTGGIGKTTVIKYYLDRIQKDHSESKIIFISSHEMIHALSTTGIIANLYDFYTVFFKKTFEDDSDNEELLDKSSFELLIDHGKIIVVIDGIDEVLAKLSDRFKVNNLMSSIFNDYLDTLAKSKIIFTCRDEFWDIDEEYEEKISVLDLLPFDEKQAKSFFEKKFKNEGKVNKALKLAKKFTMSGDNSYIPYVLDMVKEDLLIEAHSVEENSSLLHSSISNEFLIIQVCDREIKKMGFVDISVQLDFFMKLAVEYEGKVLSRNCTFISSTELQKYQSHPLLLCSSSDKKDNILSFRYDFFTDYFKALYVYSYLNNKENIAKLRKMDVSEKRKLIDLTNGQNISSFFIEKFKVFPGILDILQTLLADFMEAVDEDISIEDKELSSAIFILILTMCSNKDKEYKTELLELIYTKNNIISNLTLKNAYSTSKIIFDFSGLQFKQAYIENYSDFCLCNFSNETLFKDSILIPPLWKDKGKLKFQASNFDELSQRNSPKLMEKLLDMENQIHTEAVTLADNIKKCLKIFWQGGCFREIVADDVNRRMKKNSDILKSLIDINVIKEIKKTTSEKRNQNAYEINIDLQSELSKILDQNSSNYAFQELIKNVQMNMNK